MGSQVQLRRPRVAFVSGANGISGHAIVEHLIRQPESEWSQIVVSSRRQLPNYWADPRIDFVSVDFMHPVQENIARLKGICQDVIHVFYTSYAHSDDFKGLPEKNVPLFKNFMDVIDGVCPQLQSVCIYTGGKYYGAHLGKLKAPAEESAPRYQDDGDNFYYNQEDYLRAVQKRRDVWSWNVIRPTGIIGFTPHANGMTEALTLAVYFLICREIKQTPKFPGNEYIWNGVDDKSYAPSIADLAVFVSTHEHCANEAFNHANGDVFIWKNFWPKVAGYFGLETIEPTFEKARGNSSVLITEIDLVEWAKDKREAWSRVVERYGGKDEVFDWAAWGHLSWGMGRAWSTLLSVGKARKFGWQRYDDTFETWIKTYKVLENAGILPSSRLVRD
ncbi:hypothetical protein CNMCM8980_004507 [Aspergillus fumigatiaffinis]|uniref:PRISE-like Rossmann-fold domain-containing protein n=1 Tax=Aspergillus fumigatiaffinis TaxID=340414 RepID=A0A8H4M360_9EURO|nr:hypothetical protein CNMCM6457_003648 [Aspergillus fumigatiaffinis]KAF4221691.1 hypothetical protein CNMCM5878_008115 [Aspergillus fumigatiaffinis]KAF4221801.1 hypothetical protein CNMCM5878_008225 [Aspergillus fumigatiaffinis]KAF4226582.1 hypothetical protein CNMCM6805_004379 [Aspergillus fumigatiaffinis]KAF4233173.1 hypothetical protein CNMCM8980_004507 [Aspergillus fumigatiaffinis]